MAYSLPPKRITDPEELERAKVKWAQQDIEHERNTRAAFCMAIAFYVVVFLIAGVTLTATIVRLALEKI